jgi:hypothetical protein
MEEVKWNNMRQAVGTFCSFFCIKLPFLSNGIAALGAFVILIVIGIEFYTFNKSKSPPPPMAVPEERPPPPNGEAVSQAQVS